MSADENDIARPPEGDNPFPQYTSPDPQSDDVLVLTKSDMLGK